MMNQILKNVGHAGNFAGRPGLLVAGALGLAATVMVPAPAKADFRIGVAVNEPPQYVQSSSQVWCEPVYRIVTERVWVAPIYTTVTENVWVPEQIQYREYPHGTGSDCWVERVPVGVIPGHYERQSRQVESVPGHWEDVARQELVTAGHWESRVIVVTPPSSSAWFGFDLNQRDRDHNDRDHGDWDHRGSSRYDQGRHDDSRHGDRNNGRSGGRSGGHR
jgi:hypothetical protein